MIERNSEVLVAMTNHNHGIASPLVRPLADAEFSWLGICLDRTTTIGRPRKVVRHANSVRAARAWISPVRADLSGRLAAVSRTAARCCFGREGTLADLAQRRSAAVVDLCRCRHWLLWVGERLFTIGGRCDDEFLIALNLKDVTDKSLAQAWATRIGPTFDFKGNSWNAGPNSTPTVDGNLVFALGGNGHLICAETTSGKEIWHKDLPTELEAEVNPIGGGPKKLGWGFTWSPFVDGTQLVSVPGGPKGTLAALNKQTGEVLWRSTEITDQAAYTSPMIAEIDGVRQYVVLTNRSIVGVAAKDGRVLWTYLPARPYGTEVVNSPIIHDSFVYVTVGASHGCELIRVTKDGETLKAESVYNNKNLSNHHGNVVLVGEHLFGLAENRGWLCQKFSSGEIVWSERQKLRPGSVTCAGGRLYCYDESDGTVALIDVSTDGWKESCRFRIPQQTKQRRPRGGIWTPPIVSGGRLFLRDQELLFCFDVQAKK